MNSLASLDMFAAAHANLHIKLFLGHHVGASDNGLILGPAIVLSPPPQPTLNGAADNDYRDRDPKQEHDRVRCNGNIDTTTLGGISWLRGQGTFLTIGLCPCFFVGRQNDPAEEIEDGQDHGNQDGGCLCPWVIDDPR